MIRSQQTWAAAAQAGHFADEIGPVTLKTRKGEVEFALDEHPKPKTTIEQLRTENTELKAKVKILLINKALTADI